MRLDAAVARSRGVSRAEAARLIAAGAVSVDGAIVLDKSRVVAPAAVLDIADAPGVASASAAPAPVSVVTEDEHLLVVEKPAGLVVHPAPGLRDATLVDALRGRGVALAPRGGDDRPGIVHRLDRDVSGLMLVAKTDQAHEALARAISERTVVREYLAGVAGEPAVATGRIEAPVGRNPRNRSRMAVVADGLEAVTWFRVRERLGAFALLEVRLDTGRTHQIRTHLASIGHPILGDASYGRPLAGLRRPFLHAFRLTFPHPVSGDELSFTSELPPDLLAALDGLRSA